MSKNNRLCNLNKPASVKTRCYNLPAKKTCPFAKDCLNFCYADKGCYKFSNVRAAHERNFLETKEPLAFYFSMSAELGRSRAGAVRIHTSGDFYSSAYLANWLRLAKENPRKQFYAYTKSISWAKAAKAEGLVPANFEFIFSFGGTEDDLIDPETDRHAKVFDSIEELEAAGYEYCDDDTKAWASKNHRIGLLKH